MCTLVQEVDWLVRPNVNCRLWTVDLQTHGVTDYTGSALFLAVIQ